MNQFLLETFLPFILSAAIVIAVTMLAERYGTKVGGILGTLPHLVIVAFVFIARKEGVDFASEAAHIVAAEVGVNLVFLLLFSRLCHRSLSIALGVSLGAWVVLSSLLVFGEFTNIYSSLLIYVVVVLCSLVLLEKVWKVKSSGKVNVHYTRKKMIFRGLLAGTVIASSVALSSMGTIISGIFTVFPALFLSAMVISHLEHGPNFTSAMGKSMIFGSPSVVSYSLGVHFLYPELGILWGTLASTAIALCVGLTIFSFREKIS